MEDTAKSSVSQGQTEQNQPFEGGGDLTKREVMRLFARTSQWVVDHATELGHYWATDKKMRPVAMFRRDAVRAFLKEEREWRRQKGIIEGNAEPLDMTVQQVAEYLQMSVQWVRDNRHQFQVYYVPGRGKSGRMIRFTRKSVIAYRERLLLKSQPRDDANDSSGMPHETLDQIINRVKRERAAAG